MTNKYFDEDLSTDLEKKISHLINLCGDLRGQYSIGQIKSNKMATAQNAKEAVIDQTLEIQDLSKNPIECPIIMDEDVPQILVDECEPLFLGVEKSIVDDISACPLRILNYPEIRLKFKGLLSTYTGVKYADKLLKNPFTQNRLLGAIPLGTHKSHVQVGNYTLAKMISGGKILGNLNLYYAVVWYLINEDEINYLKDVKLNATEHLVFRLKTSNTMASLCGLPQFVTTQISSDIAIWYCVNSGFLNQPTDRDTFRFHFYNLEPMIKITEVLGYPNHEGLQAHLLRTKALLTMLNHFKKLNNSQKKTFKNIFKGLYQRGIFVDATKVSPKFKELEICTEFVPIDGPADEAQIKHVRERLPKYTLEMTNEDLYYISTLLDAQKSASDIYLDYNLVAPPLPQAEVNWCYGLDFEDTSHVEINPKTVRPFYHVGNKIWDQCARERFGVDDVKKLFRGCKWIENYLVKYEKKPEPVELLLFYYNREIEAGKVTTLPVLTEKWTLELVAAYEVCFPEGYDIKEVLKRLNESRSIVNRIKIETS
jgi:hypothetical protein